MSWQGALSVALAILAATLVVGTTACGGAKAAQMAVSLKEWSITPDVTQAKAGKVKFVVANDGKEPHEFVIIRSDLGIDDLPVVDGKVEEEKVQIIDEIEPFAAGATESISLDLKAGRYILVCNIVEKVPGQPVESHYLNGMRAAFTVSQ